MLEAVRRKLFGRNQGEPIVVVSGLPRSGTSMIPTSRPFCRISK